MHPSQNEWLVNQQVHAHDSDRRSTTNRTLAAAFMLLVLAGLVTLGVLQMSERSARVADARKISRLEAQDRDLRTKLAQVNGDDGASGIATLSDEIKALQSTVTTLTQKEGTTSSRLANICNSQSVSNEQSTLTGEETGSGASGSQYYLDLEAILSAVCQ